MLLLPLLFSEELAPQILFDGTREQNKTRTVEESSPLLMLPPGISSIHQMNQIKLPSGLFTAASSVHVSQLQDIGFISSVTNTKDDSDAKYDNTITSPPPAHAHPHAPSSQTEPTTTLITPDSTDIPQNTVGMQNNNQPHTSTTIPLVVPTKPKPPKPSGPPPPTAFKKKTTLHQEVGNTIES